MMSRPKDNANGAIDFFWTSCHPPAASEQSINLFPPSLMRCLHLTDLNNQIFCQHLEIPPLLGVITPYAQHGKVLLHLYSKSEQQREQNAGKPASLFGEIRS